MTMEEIREIQQIGIRMKKKEEARKQEEMKRLGITPIPAKKPTYDHPNSLENDEATVLWVVVMVVGSIFVDRMLIWIMATIVYLRYLINIYRD